MAARPLLRKLAPIVLIAACLLSLALRWRLTEQLPFMMDELVDTQLGVQVQRGVRLYADIPFERMPLLPYLVAWTHDPTDGSFATAVGFRRFMWLGTLLVTVGTWFVARSFLSRSASLLAPFLLLGFSSFLDRSIRTRADLVSTLCSMPALIFVTRRRLTLPAAALAGLGLGVAFITTQKAVYFVVAFAVALLGRSFLARPREPVARVAALAAVSALAFFVPLALLSAWMAHLESLEAFVEQCFVWGASVGLANDTYADTRHFVGQTMRRNPGFWLLGLFGTVWLLRRVARRQAGGSPGTGPELGLALWTLAMVGLILQHTVKFPYVFLNLSPCLAAAGAVFLHHAMGVVGTWQIPWRRAVAALVFLAALVVFPASHHRRNFEGDLIQGQKAIMDRVDAVTETSDAVVDGVGMAVTRRKATPYSMTRRWKRERQQGAGYDVLSWLRKTGPKAMIANYRLRHLPRSEQEFLRSRFVHDWANVWVVGATIEHPGGESSHEVELLAATEYAVEAADLATVTIDGRPARGVMALAAGPHRVDIRGQARRLILRQALALRPPAHPEVEAFLLYPSYSD